MNDEIELTEIVRQRPTEERLANCRARLSLMCSERRPPRMSIPVSWNDDDFFISTTLWDAAVEIKSLNLENDALAKKLGDYVAWHLEQGGMISELRRKLAEADEIVKAAHEWDTATKEFDKYYDDPNTDATPEWEAVITRQRNSIIALASALEQKP